MAKSAPKLDPRGRKVKILATVGPASRSPEMLARLFKAGVDAFRVNMSHGEHADRSSEAAGDGEAVHRSIVVCGFERRPPDP